MKLGIKVPPSPCLGCGEINDMAGTAADRDPEPGDITLCWYCGHFMVFADDLTLRNPTGAEMLIIAGDPELLRLQAMRAKEKTQETKND